MGPGCHKSDESENNCGELVIYYRWPMKGAAGTKIERVIGRFFRVAVADEGGTVELAPVKDSPSDILLLVR